MILEYTLKIEKIPHIHHITSFYPFGKDIVYKKIDNKIESMMELDLVKSFSIHNDSYTKVIFTSLSLIPMSKQIEKLKEVMNNDN